MGEVKLKPSYEVRVIGFFFSCLIIGGMFYQPFSPEFIYIAFLSAIATAVVNFAAGVAAGATGISTAAGLGSAAAIGVGVGQVVATIALSAASRALTKELADDEKGGESLSNRTRTTRQPAEARRVIYGRSKVGGTITFLEETDNNKFLHMNIVVADHEIEQYADIFLDKNKLDLSGNIDFKADINEANKSNDEFIVSGKRTDDISDNDTITVDGNEERRDTNNDGSLDTTVSNDGDYTVDGSPTYDSNNQETTISVDENVEYDIDNEGTVEYTIENVADTSSNYGDKVLVRKYLGKPNQTAEEILINQSPNWTESHRGRGVAYLYVRLEWDRNTFTGGIPNVSAVVDGKNDVYDPRDNTNKFTDNPVLCIRDYILDERRGLGASIDEIDDEVTKSAANTCDEQIDLDGGGTQDRYNLNGTIKLDQRPMDIIRDMNSSMDGTTIYTNGQYHINAGEHTSPVLELGETDLRSSITVNTKRSRRDSFNRIKGVYVSPENDWQPTDFPPITDSTALSNDNNEKRWKDLELPYTTNPARAQRLGKHDLARNRQQKTIEANFNLRAMELVVDDIFEFTFDRYGWDKKQFRVQDWSLTVSVQDDGSPALIVKILAQEWDSSVYDWDPSSDEQAVSNAPESNLPDPGDVSAPTNLQLESGDDQLFIEPDGTVVPRINATWNQPTDEFVTSGGNIEIQFKQSSESNWENGGFVDGSEIQDFLSSVKSGIDYDVRIRSVSTFGFTSSWTRVNNHTVIGKTALPSDVNGLSATQNGRTVNITWRRVTDDDLGGYIIKYGDIDDSDWENSRTLTEVAAGTTITSQVVPPGDHTLYIKAIDTSGNLSQNADTFNIEVVTDFDILHERQYAPAWDDFAGTDGILEAGSWGLESWGSFTWGADGPSFYKHWTGKLVPASSKSASDHTNEELFENYVPYPVGVSGYQGEEHDVGTEVTARLYGNINGAFGRGQSGEFTPILQVDARSEGEQYDGFEDWTVGEKKGRFFKFRVKLINEAGSVAYLNGFKESADAEERTESGTIDVSASGTTVVFDTPFVNTPFITLTVPSGSAKIANPDNITTVDFEANVFDTDGTQVSQDNVEYQAEGV